MKDLKLPWRVDDEIDPHFIETENWDIICRFFDCNGNDYNNKEFNVRQIIKAVNYHDRLVEALRECVDLIDRLDYAHEQSEKAEDLLNEIKES